MNVLPTRKLRTISLTRLFICNFSDREADYTRIEEALWLYRDIGRPFQTHHNRAESWTYAPFPINPVNWFTYYVLLRDVVDYLRSQNFEQNPTIYLHASVICPCTVVHHALFRYYMYDLFMFNTPAELYACISHVKFRFFFLSTTAVPRQEIACKQLFIRLVIIKTFHKKSACCSLNASPLGGSLIH